MTNNHVSTVLISGVFLLLGLAAFAAESPKAGSRQSLKELVAELQKSPDDQALREKIIKLALSMKPRPKAPEEVDELVGEAVYSFKNAKGEADYAAAAEAYNKVLLLAPWIADHYFNLGVAQEKAKRPDEAVASFKLYLLAAPAARDAKTVRERIGGLKAAARKAAEEASPAGQRALEKSKEQKFLESLEGGRWDGDVWSGPVVGGTIYQRPIWKVANGELIYSGVSWQSGEYEPSDASRERQRLPLNGPRATFDKEALDPSCNPVTIEISADGSVLTETYNCYGRTIVNRHYRKQL